MPININIVLHAMMMENIVRNSIDDQNGTKKSSYKKRSALFPHRLYDMLENAERDGYSKIISWMPDGKSFRIHVEVSHHDNEEDDSGKAIVKILKRTFKHSKFKSFLRQLQIYGFERTNKGIHRGECKHRLFIRSRRDLLIRKSLEDFQQQSNNNDSPINYIPLSARYVCHLLSPEESIFLNNDRSNYWIPVCYSSGCNNGCQYLKTSTIIPTRLKYLIMTTDSNNESGNHSEEKKEDVIFLDDEKKYKKDVDGDDKINEEFDLIWTNFEHDI